MKALYFENFGGPDVLKYGELANPSLGEQELLVRTDYIGLNFADIYRRRGDYHIEAHQPYIDGYEGVGTVIAIGAAVKHVEIGTKIMFVDVPFANAELVAVPVSHAILIPATLDLKVAAAIGLQGLTADFLAHDLGLNHPNDRVFIHGISGGVGQILSQMLTADGVAVYGVTSNKRKQRIALAQGAKQVVLRTDDWLDDYQGTFTTVYDGVGITVAQSIQLLKHRGKVVFFGMAGGNPPKLDLVKLLAASKSVVTGDLWDYLDSFEQRQARSWRLFNYFTAGKIKISDPTVFKLSDGKRAHELLESGKSSGKILMVP